MSTVETVKLAHYTLVCSARKVDSGRYMPLLTVASNIWPSRPRNIAVQGRDFESEAHALAAAHDQGLVWVADFGARRPPEIPGLPPSDGHQAVHVAAVASKDGAR